MGRAHVSRHQARGARAALITGAAISCNHRAGLGVDDEARADAAIKGIVGKRLTYKAADSAKLNA